MIVTPPSEKADLAQDLKISEVDDHNVCIGMYVICHKQVYFFNVMLCDKLALSWNSPCHPNGGRVDYFCFGVVRGIFAWSSLNLF
jgi:hypothetical protein